jgi:hypothetical protein
VRRWSQPCSGVPQILDQEHSKDQSALNGNRKRKPQSTPEPSRTQRRRLECTQGALKISEEQAPQGLVAQNCSAVSDQERRSSPVNGTCERQLSGSTRGMLERLDQPPPASTPTTTARNSVSHTHIGEYSTVSPRLASCGSASTDHDTLSNDSSNLAGNSGSSSAPTTLGRRIETLMIDLPSPLRTSHDTATVPLEPSQRSEKALTEDYNQTWTGQMVSTGDGDEVDGKSEVVSATTDKVSNQLADTLTSCSRPTTNPQLPALQPHIQPEANLSLPDLRLYGQPTVDPKLLGLRLHNQPTTNPPLPDLRLHSQPTVDPKWLDLRLHSQPMTSPQPPDFWLTANQRRIQCC